MAKEVIVINEPKDLNRFFKVGTLLQIEGKVIKVEEDVIGSSCSLCAFNDGRRLEKYCDSANCFSNGFDSGCHFIEIEQ